MNTSKVLWLGFAVALVGCDVADALEGQLEDGGYIRDIDRNPRPDAPTRAPTPANEPVECGGTSCEAVMIGNSLLPACCTPTDNCGVDATLLAEAGAPFSGCVALGQSGDEDSLCPNVTVEVADRDVELTGCCRSTRACGVLADDLSLAGMQSVELGLGCVAPPGATTSIPCGMSVDPGDGEEPEPPEVTPDEDVRGTVGPAGGEVVLQGKASVAIPAQALDADVEISISEIDATTIREVPSILRRVGKPFAFEPHGHTFAFPATIELNYTGSSAGLMVARLDDATDRVWSLVPARFREGVAIVVVDGFSIYSLVACVEADRCQSLLRQTNCDAQPDDEVNDLDLDGIANVCDACRNDPNKIEVGECGCGVSENDRDFDTTPDCFDECDDDAAKTAPGICGCGLTEADLDQDTVPDCIDACPEDPAKTEPGACGCGAVDTDSDGDYTANCDDACPEDPGKTAAGTCGCGTAETDSDGDLTPNCVDECPLDANKTVPGDCGCGIFDGDSDNDGARDCDDECRFDASKQLAGVCGCNVPDADTDEDETPDCIDQCPTDAGKTQPLVCGCGRPDADTDSDGALDCIDLCAEDPAKVAPEICGCGQEEVLDDDDEDTYPLCRDECPSDPLKAERGICPCGIADDPADNDGDGVIDCEDECDVDPTKSEAGLCGCNLVDDDTDSDSDGTVNCLDQCPSDPNKALDIGLCGCNVVDNETDSDFDGVADCVDACPSDPAKTQPGICGCNAVDDSSDSDADGIPNCVDLCNGNNWYGDSNPQDGVCDKPPPSPDCQSNQLDCDGETSNGCEVDRTTDDNNCGACGVRCGADAVCSAGACTAVVPALAIEGAAANTASTSVTLWLRPIGNLVTNAYADQGTTGYEVHATANGWATIGGGPFTNNAWVGSYSYEELRQVVDLTAAITAAELDTQTVPLQLGAWSSGYSWAADRIVVRVEFLNESNGVLNSRTLFDAVVGGASWAFRGATLADYPVGTRRVRIVIGEDDGEYWSGHYGAVFDAVTVSVGAREMRFSNDGTTWSAWEPAASTKAWTLTSGAGTKSVYMQMRNPATPEAIVSSVDTITLD